MKISYRWCTMITLLLTSLSGLAMGWLCDSSIGWRYPLFQVIGVFLGFWVGCLIRAVPQIVVEDFSVDSLDEKAASLIAPNEKEEQE